jgi:hypothetical protein
MKRSTWSLMAASFMVLSVFAAWGAPDAGLATVGDFALKISRAMGQQPADQAAAVAALRKAGVDLGKDLGAGLTAGRAASILRDLGLRVTAPQEPAAAISVAKADQIVRAFALTRGQNINSRDRSLRDCPPSPSSPDDCDDDDDHDDGDHDGDHHGHDGDHRGDHDGDHDDHRGHHDD